MTATVTERAVAPDLPVAAAREDPAPAASPRRHLAWLAAGLIGGFLVPFALADQLEVQRDVFYGLYALSVTSFVAAWARDTGYPLAAAVRRRPRLTAGLTVGLAAATVLMGIKAEDAGTHPGGLGFVGALLWRGLVYGLTDGLLLSAFPILVIFAAFGRSRLRRRRGGVAAIAAIGLGASMLMTTTYHLGYSDFRSDKLARPVTGTLVWSPATLAAVNPLGAPIVHATLHVTAVTHNYETDLFLPPH